MSNEQTPYTQEKYVTWDDVQAHCRKLAADILGLEKKYEKILVITRGGMFPAGILARELEIRRIENICVDTYELQDSQKIKQPALLKPAATEYLKDVLIVDDLADTGATLKMVRDMTTDALVVTIFAKPAGESLVDLFSERVAQKVWVRFPWDTEKGQQFVQPLARKPPARTP
ncbi:MAG TPA: xanthine phosphoribosyltransferase [Micavibrio sp.]